MSQMISTPSLILELQNGDLHRVSRMLNAAAQDGARCTFAPFYTLGQVGLTVTAYGEKKPDLIVHTDAERPVRVEGTAYNQRYLLPIDSKPALLAEALCLIAAGVKLSVACPQPDWFSKP